ncbi:hypothetical protein F5B21DRAFT_317265 [Xylaria acuta]|nr:hypothetical protein F5B21DRAFT_317265 [Xylaria acuta]
MSWLKMIVDTYINLSNKLRTASMISTVTEDILEDSESSRGSTSAGEANADEDIDSAVRLLKGPVKAFESHILYLKERADRLFNMIFALFTHEDAAVSADMAKSSQALAEQST